MTVVPPLWIGTAPQLRYRGAQALLCGAVPGELTWAVPNGSAPAEPDPGEVYPGGRRELPHGAEEQSRADSSQSLPVWPEAVTFPAWYYQSACILSQKQAREDFHLTKPSVTACPSLVTAVDCLFVWEAAWKG